MIAIVDYGMGNLGSVYKALTAMGAQANITDDKSEIGTADALILPGVGAFGEAVANLDRRGLRDVVVEFFHSGRPFLGICLGLQLLFAESEECPGVKGLGVLPGKVKRFSHDLKIPHMGWNQVQLSDPCSPWLADVSSGDYFYFVHSFYVETEDKYVAARSQYGHSFVAAVWGENMFACQFHPEKSQEKGLSIVRRFGGCL